MNNLSKLITSESKFIEFKVKYTKSLLKTVNAFSNYHNGKIIIGIDDYGEIVGVENPRQVRLNIENTINDSINPRPDFEMDTITDNGRTLIIINVYKGMQTPYIYDRRAYKRSDTSTVPVEKHEYDELVLYGRNLSFEELNYNSNDLNFNILESFLIEHLSISSLNQDIMKSLGLFTEKGHNNAAALLADSNSEISNSVDFICYHDNSLLNIKDRIKVESSSLIEHFNKATLFYDKHINKGHIIDGFYREEIPDIPKEAYREAILNSIIHRDYSRNGSNRIEIFPDRVEITSIGTLPPGISENEFINGTISNVRNQIVADLFLRCHLIERLGTGIRKIKYLFNKSSNQPTFKVFQNSIQIILPKLNITYMLSDSMRSKLESEEDKLLNYIFSLEKVTRPEVEKYMGIKKTKATNLLKVLIDKNFIIKIGNGKSTYYKAK